VQNTITSRAMAEGALLAVITAILALAGTYIPLASFFTVLIVAVPIIIVIVRNNLSTGIIASIVAAFLVGVLAGPIIAVAFYIQFMTMALVYGYMFKHKKGAGKILVVGTFVAALSTILLIAITMLIGQMDLQEQKQVLFQTVDRTIEIYEDYGMMENLEKQGIDKEKLQVMLTNSIKLLLRVLPAILIIGSIFTAVTHFIMARLALNRLGYESPKFPSFSEWNLPWYTIWGLIGGWGSYLLGQVYKLNFWTILGQNIMIAYGMILFVLGLSVITFFLKKYKLSKTTRILILLAGAIMFQLAVMLVIFIGMFDLVLDHRKLNKRLKPS